MNNQALPSILLIAPSNGHKPYKVINDLINNQEFNNNYRLFVVVDKNNGRLVKLLHENSIPFTSLETNTLLIEAINHLKDSHSLSGFEVLVTCGWGRKVSSDVISTASIAAINCHSSLLPDYKGGSVYYHQWANAEKFGGATIHYLTEQFDSGNIICQGSFSIGTFDSPDTILSNSSKLTSSLLPIALELAISSAVGSPNIGGRYFKKQPFKRLLLHRIVNLCLRVLGFKKRWLTKWK